MGILNRLNTLVRASLGDITDRVSDPGAKITLVLHEMDSHIKAARREIQDLLVTEKRLEAEHAKLKTGERQWEDRASKAVKLGDDNLARQCLYRKFEAEKSAEDLSREIEEGRTHIRGLLKASRRLEARIKSLRIQEKSFKNAIRKGGSGNAFAEFQRMENSVEGQLAESELDAELDPTVRALEEEILKQRLADLENAVKADDELLKIKDRIFEHGESDKNSPETEDAPQNDKRGVLQEELDAIRRQLNDEWESGNSLEDLERRYEDPQ